MEKGAERVAGSGRRRRTAGRGRRRLQLLRLEEEVRRARDGEFFFFEPMIADRAGTAAPPHNVYYFGDSFYEQTFYCPEELTAEARGRLKQFATPVTGILTPAARAATSFAQVFVSGRHSYVKDK